MFQSKSLSGPMAVQDLSNLFYRHLGSDFAMQEALEGMRIQKIVTKNFFRIREKLSAWRMNRERQECRKDRRKESRSKKIRTKRNFPLEI